MMMSQNTRLLLCLLICFYSTCLFAFRVGHFARPIPLNNNHITNTNHPNNINKIIFMANPKPSGFPNTKEGRAVIYNRTKKLIEKSSMILVIPISGVKKTDIDLLRAALPQGTKASVVKNGIFRRALDNTPFESLQNHIKDENMYFFIEEGLYKESLNAFKKWQQDIERKDEQYNPKIACLEGTIFEKLQIEEACKIPNRKQVMGRFVRVLRSIPEGIHSSINAVPRELVLTLDRVKDKMEAAEKAAVPSA